MELCVRSVHPTADTERVSPPRAWLAAARQVDESVIAQFSRQLKADVSLHTTSAGDVQSGEIPEGVIVARHPLPALDGTAPVAELRAAFRIEALTLGEHYNRREMLVLIAAGMLMLGVGSWSINLHVLRPLRHIGESLAGDSPRPLARVSPDLQEFTRIADLIRQSFRQREALSHEIAERVRMGRDLHDGVIQNLYATGMGLAQAKRLVATNPEQACAVLEETRLTLNLTMETLRRFIARAEPEAAGAINFADACVELFQTLRARRNCELDLDIDAQLAARVPADRLADLLFIVRESVSNALRHGDARQIKITLLSDEKRSRAHLRIRDNGKGCDFEALPAANEKGGRGLSNIRNRARALGGEARFENHQDGGVIVAVDWPA
jgi:signal transduction histidine kinase